MFDSPNMQPFMTDPGSVPGLGIAMLFGSLAEVTVDDFFAVGGLTVYSTASSPWRWLVCAGHKPLQATVIDATSFLEGAVPVPAIASNHKLPSGKKVPVKKLFEQSKLVQWLTRAAHQTTSPYSTSPKKTLFNEDHQAFAKLIGMEIGEWATLELQPPISAMEIQHFEQSHNAALSDIEAAFLPSKVDLPLELAMFYIRYLAQARRDVEATLLIAQSSQSLRLPRLMADALAVGSYEGAAKDILRYEGNDYAASVAHDTSAFIDAALMQAMQRLSLPIDHPEHLLRLNLMAISQIASEIVEQVRLQPFAFHLKAKELYVARCDVCRFPPLQRFATSVTEHDLSMEQPWVQRIALAFERLFEGKAAPVLEAYSNAPAEILRFSR